MPASTHSREAKTRFFPSPPPPQMTVGLRVPGKSMSDNVISLVHLPTVDPNFLNMAARSPSELKAKASSSQGTMLKARHDALTKYVAEAKQAVSNAPQTDGSKGPSYEQRQCQFLEDKLAANQILLEVYEGKGGDEKEKAFFESATKSWEEGVPDVCARLEDAIKGTFVLGDHVVSSSAFVDLKECPGPKLTMMTSPLATCT